MDHGTVFAMALLLVAATVIVHYEFLRGVSGVAGRLSIPGRWQILVIIAGVLIAHLVEVTLYAVAYYASQTWLGLGKIDGQIEGNALDFWVFVKLCG